MSRYWRVLFQGHRIRVAVSPFGRAQLFVNGELYDTAQPWAWGRGSAPVLIAPIRGLGGDHRVEVYRPSLWPFTLRICVDGDCIAGESRE